METLNSRSLPVISDLRTKLGPLSKLAPAQSIFLILILILITTATSTLLHSSFPFSLPAWK
ncbi:hypothetical protein SCA6_007455 [Theobroma cacao]